MHRNLEDKEAIEKFFMKLTEIKQIEDCIDSGTIFEYFFNEAINEEFIRKLGELGRLQYYDSFSKPFFKIIADSGAQIKGILGDSYIQVVFPRTNLEEIKKEIEKFIYDILK